MNALRVLTDSTKKTQYDAYLEREHYTRLGGAAPRIRYLSDMPGIHISTLQDFVELYEENSFAFFLYTFSQQGGIFMKIG